MNTTVERYERLKEKVVDRKISFNKLMSFLEAETDYLIAPASTRFHLSQEQGLLEHFCNVAETMSDDGSLLTLNEAAEWSGRARHTSVALLDGSICKIN